MATTTRLYSSCEAAEALDLTPGRIRQICRWEVIGQKLGRDWFLTDADLELIRMKFPKKRADSDDED